MNKEEIQKRMDNGDYAMRSCWNCNSAHKHLKRANYIIWCFICGNLYYKGKELKLEGDSNE